MTVIIVSKIKSYKFEVQVYRYLNYNEPYYEYLLGMHLFAFERLRSTTRQQVHIFRKIRLRFFAFHKNNMIRIQIFGNIGKTDMFGLIFRVRNLEKSVPICLPRSNLKIGRRTKSFGLPLTTTPLREALAHIT